MHSNAELIERFYRAFQARDAAAMGACYADDVHFSDPVFPELRGARARAMWRMLCERGKDLELTFDNVSADDTKGTAHWEARYTFSQTGRRVHNVIDATFELKNGKIVDHKDVFDFWRWAGMALGPTGKLLGWTPMIQKAVRGRAEKGLEAFIKAKGL